MLQITYLVFIFNGIFDTRNFPEEWWKAIITVNSYRGIPLLSVLSKMFTGILNDRLKMG